MHNEAEKITTIVFDCFGVICDPVIQGWHKAERASRGFADDNLPGLFRQFDLGTLSEDDFLEYLHSYEDIDETRDELREKIDSYFGINTELVGLIKRLRAAGYRTALLSNGNHGFFERKIYPTYPEFKELFDKMFISSLVGKVKPNADAYEHVLEELKVTPGETAFVDDSPVNVEAANNIGMHGLGFTDAATLESELRHIGVAP